MKGKSRIIFKVMSGSEWSDAEAAGGYHGGADDQRDGFIHFSTALQLPETLRRHFAGRADLVLLAVDASALGDDLKWEASRGGALFPHLYASMPCDAVQRVWPLSLGADGMHILPRDYMG